MLGDAVAAKKSSGEAKESLEVVDVAQLLIRSVQAPALVGAAAEPAEPAADPAAGSEGGAPEAAAGPEDQA
jgi:hypothetical protein